MSANFSLGSWPPDQILDPHLHHTHTHSGIHTQAHTYTHTQALTHTYTHTCHSCTHTHTRAHAHTHTHTHTRTHTRAYAHTHTNRHAYTHTHTHTVTSEVNLSSCFKIVSSLVDQNLQIIEQTSGGSRIFPRGGREPSRGGVNTPNFPENCMKSKEFGRPGGGVRPSRPPPRSANANCENFINITAENGHLT